jgi:opacity protein-like surface antigen
MNKSTSMLLSLVAVASIASSTVAQAQLSRPVKFTIFGGASLPSGDAGDALKTGYTLGGAADLRAPLMPVGLRAELAYSRLGAKDTGGLESLNMNDLGGNANVVLWVPSVGTPLTAYLTGGPSYSKIEFKASDSGQSGSVSQNHWGFNVGAGIDFALGGLGTRLDVRYRQISMDDGDNLKTIPITFGFTF